MQRVRREEVSPPRRTVCRSRHVFAVVVAFTASAHDVRADATVDDELARAKASAAEQADERSAYPGLHALTFFERNYLITGFDKASQAKGQFSLKFNLWPWVGPHGLYIGYTQLMLFNVYDFSTPLAEINFNPTLLYEYTFFDPTASRIAAEGPRCTTSRLRAELEHLSNGQADYDSRSFNRLSGEVAFGCYDRRDHNLEVVVRAWPPLIGADENPDMVDFIGYAELTLGYRSPSTGHWTGQADVEVLLRKGTAPDPTRGAFVLNAAWHPYFGEGFEETWRFVPYVYAQFFTGYAETLSTYNVFQNLFRVGIGFSDDLNPPKGPRFVGAGEP